MNAARSAGCRAHPDTHLCVQMTNGGKPITGKYATVSMVDPRVRRLKGAGSVLFTCVRLVQTVSGEVRATSQTRIWELQSDSRWRCVHFHASPLTL